MSKTKNYAKEQEAIDREERECQMDATIIVLANQKGGAGKTTTANALASELMYRKYRVLMIDCDAQHNTTDMYHAKWDGVATLYDVLVDGAPIDEALYHTECGDIIPGDENFYEFDVKSNNNPRKEFLLRDAIVPLLKRYDYIIIDTNPSLGLMLTNALTCADYVIVPVESGSGFNIKGLDLITKSIQRVQQHSNHNLQNIGILETRYQSRPRLLQVLGELLRGAQQQYHTEVFTTRIRHSIKAQEANAAFEQLRNYSPRCTTAQDYSKFCDELLERIEHNGKAQV